MCIAQAFDKNNQFYIHISMGRFSWHWENDFLPATDKDGLVEKAEAYASRPVVNFRGTNSRIDSILIRF